MIRRDVQEALGAADEIINTSGFRNYWWIQSWAQVIRGWALAEQGQAREGLALVQQVVARFRAQGFQGMQGGRTYYLWALAGIHLKLGQLGEGLAVVRDALGQVQETGEHVIEAELHRLRGELLRAGGREREAQEEFLRAIVIAREQGALLFELRAVMGLGWLLRDTGRPAGARKRLTRILARFEASVDSTDLREARALLAKVSNDS